VGVERSPADVPASKFVGGSVQQNPNVELVLVNPFQYVSLRLKVRVFPSAEI
jgi:hypothetical protein